MSVLAADPAPNMVFEPDIDVVARACNRGAAAPFYASKFRNARVRSWDDFYALPWTTKQELREAKPADTLAVPLREVWRYHESFGTTGRPMATWFTRTDFERELELTERWTRCIAPDSKILNRLPYSFAVPPFVLERRTHRDGGIIIPASNLTWNVSPARTLDLMERLQTDILVGFPLEPVLLELAAPACGYDLTRDFRSLKHFLLGGGPVVPALQEYIQNRWRASVGLVYGLTETGGIASMCDAWRLHVHPHAFVLEVVDTRSGHHVANGDIGLLLVTSYYRQAAPLFRYNSRDYCRMHTDPCPCGDPSPTIEILGRQDTTIELHGRRLYFARLEQAILEFTKQFDSVLYFAVVTDRALTIRVESCNGERMPQPGTLDQLQDTLRVPCKVTVGGPGTVLDSESLMRFPQVFKPHKVCDWRTDSRRCVDLSEALVEWPHVGFGELLRIIWRFFRNALLRRCIR